MRTSLILNESNNRRPSESLTLLPNQTNSALSRSFYKYGINYKAETPQARKETVGARKTYKFKSVKHSNFQFGTGKNNKRPRSLQANNKSTRVQTSSQQGISFSTYNQNTSNNPQHKKTMKKRILNNRLREPSLNKIRVSSPEAQNNAVLMEEIYKLRKDLQRQQCQLERSNQMFRASQQELYCLEIEYDEEKKINKQQKEKIQALQMRFDNNFSSMTHNRQSLEGLFNEEDQDLENNDKSGSSKTDSKMQQERRSSVPNKVSSGQTLNLIKQSKNQLSQVNQKLDEMLKERKSTQQFFQVYSINQRLSERVKALEDINSTLKQTLSSKDSIIIKSDQQLVEQRKQIALLSSQNNNIKQEHFNNRSILDQILTSMTLYDQGTIDNVKLTKMLHQVLKIKINIPNKNQTPFQSEYRMKQFTSNQQVESIRSTSRQSFTNNYQKQQSVVISTGKATPLLGGMLNNHSHANYTSSEYDEQEEEEQQQIGGSVQQIEEQDLETARSLSPSILDNTRKRKETFINIQATSNQQQQLTIKPQNNNNSAVNNNNNNSGVINRSKINLPVYQSDDDEEGDEYNVSRREASTSGHKFRSLEAQINIDGFTNNNNNNNSRRKIWDNNQSNYENLALSRSILEQSADFSDTSHFYSRTKKNDNESMKRLSFGLPLQTNQKINNNSSNQDKQDGGNEDEQQEQFRQVRPEDLSIINEKSMQIALNQLFEEQKLDEREKEQLLEHFKELKVNQKVKQSKMYILLSLLYKKMQQVTNRKKQDEAEREQILTLLQNTSPPSRMYQTYHSKGEQVISPVEMPVGMGNMVRSLYNPPTQFINEKKSIDLQSLLKGRFIQGKNLLSSRSPIFRLVNKLEKKILEQKQMARSVY